jgi:UDP-N-acetylglucosamine 2-epimerase (non-hydrolysing)
LKKILNIVGARPNFMKVAPLQRVMQAHPGIDAKIVHTGQHYDERMSDVFFNQLELPKPDYYLGIGGGSHTQQTARIMLAFEEVVEQEAPDLVLVVGDVNSTIACTLVAIKRGIPVAHVEAGLRSGDRSMPEELNRILTDSVSDYLFVTEQSGMINLAKEGVPDERVFFTGNVMIDSLVHFREKASKVDPLGPLGIAPKKFVLVTMHRPANVDNKEGLQSILKILEQTTRELPVIFPIHPRTRNRFQEHGLWPQLQALEQVHLLEPQGYLEFLHLMDRAYLVITDSGGIQEETTFLQVPCFTFRDTTERPVTTELGTNILFADLDPVPVESAFQRLLLGEAKQGIIPPLWDGKSAERIVGILADRI